MNDILAAARELLDYGFSLIPLKPRGKAPLLETWKELQTRLPTSEEIEQWFVRWPEANLGLITGKVSGGLVVVDADNAEGVCWIKNNMPRTSVYQKTGKGWHAFYHAAEPVNNAADILGSKHNGGPRIDIRGEGGYVVIAPSIHPDGHQYQLVFLKGFDGWNDLALFELPSVSSDSALKFRFLPIMEKVSRGQRNDALARMCGRWFGLRLGLDEVLLMAQAWSKENCDPSLPMDEVQRTVESIYKKESDKSDESVKSDLISQDQSKSVNDRSNRSVSQQQNDRRFEGNLTAEIEQWVIIQKGCFTTEQIDREFGLTLRQDKKRRADALTSLIKKNIIKRDRRVAGKYHILSNEVEWIDVTADTPTAFPLLLPLGLSDMVIIPPGSVLNIAGMTNSGKTALCLLILQMNLHQPYKKIYLMSEMGLGEYTSRVSGIHGNLLEWKDKVKSGQCSESYDGVISANNKDGLTVIDFLEEIDGEYYKVSSDIRSIYDALGIGVAIITQQKKSGATYAMGGEATAQKSRLYLSMDSLIHAPNCSVCSVRIVKAKYPKGRNCDHLERHFKLIGGSKFEPLNGWQYIKDKQREAMVKRYEKLLDQGALGHWQD